MLATAESKPIVLIADDDAGTRYVMASTLNDEGFSVVEACDGQEAIDAFIKHRPDVILMDVEMPGMDGYEACSVIRESEGGGDLPIVMVTGNDDSDSVNRAYEIGATDFIAKPINWSLIGHRLRYILRGARNLHALGISESENRALLVAIPDCIFVIDEDGIIENDLSGANSSAITGSERLIGNNICTLLPTELGAEVGSCIRAVMSNGVSRSIEYEFEVDDGEVRWYESRYVLHGADKVLLIIRDISERKLAEQRIHFLAFYDSLTGLPNCELFKERLQAVLENAKRTRESFAILYIDLNRFKRINDTLGSSIGDAVLTTIAERLYECLNESWTPMANDNCDHRWDLARLGSDEFAVLLRNPDAGPDIALISERIQTAIAMPLTLGGHEFVMTASIGVSLYPLHGMEPELLIKNANLAKDEAKRSRRNAHKLYRRSMNANAEECLDLENELRRALENDQLEMYYQPKYCSDSLEICGAESLLRWFHPERGEILPDTFIPIAEESGLITDIGRWVASIVCQQIAAWQYLEISPGPIAINVSGHEFGHGDVVSTLTDAVRNAGITASTVELEITESVLISDIRSVMQSLHALREQGFRVAVDDFGTGYSSLCYLQKFPIDVLKIDRSFVHDVERNADSRAICTAIVALARSLELAVVAEGVENNWQLEFLRRQACEIVQGFLFSRPMPADDFVELLGRGHSRNSHVNDVIQLAAR